MAVLIIFPAILQMIINLYTVIYRMYNKHKIQKNQIILYKLQKTTAHLLRNHPYELGNVHTNFGFSTSFLVFVIEFHVTDEQMGGQDL